MIECIKTLPARVKAARIEAGYTSQEKIADDLGITRDAYAYYETTRPIQMDIVPKFLDLTGVSIDWLILNVGPMKFPEEAKTMLNKIKSLNDRDLKQIAKLYEITSEGRETA